MSGVTRNPYDTARDPGGSSSGTGTAVAADFGLLGVGEDTGGSIRVPSSFCGLVGIRCTPGTISRYGMSPLVVPQDTPGPMCRTVTDTALMLDVLAGFDERDPYTATAFISGKPVGGSYAAGLSVDKIKSARIGVLRHVFGPDSDPMCRATNEAINKTLKTLEGAGTTFVEVEIPNLSHLLETTFTYPQRSRSDLDAFFGRNPHLDIKKTTDIYEAKKFHPALDLFEDIALGVGDPRKDPDFAGRLLDREELQRLVVTTLAKHNLDALAFPDVQFAAPLMDDILGQRWSAAAFPTNTLIGSQALLPAVSVPAGLTENAEGEATNGLPVGLELLGLPYHEQSLLELAYGVEQITMARRPPKL
jgi:Asp-tRNA(Asn)/Glu-tRNA(Gln) amidotransferase A subunit family amidase